MENVVMDETGREGALREVEALLRDVLPSSPFEGKVHAVGGYVRDEVRGVASKDLDAVVEVQGGAKGLTSLLHREFPRATTRPHQIGKGYPIWSISFRGDAMGRRTAGAVVEFADTQIRGGGAPGVRPIEFGTLDQDVRGRDFTVNMLLKNLTTGEVMDPSGCGLRDVEDGVIRSHPDVDFCRVIEDDPLRMMRLVRFSSVFCWHPIPNAVHGVRRLASLIGGVARERVRDEIVKVMNAGALFRALGAMDDLNLLPLVFPEVAAMKGVEHGKARSIHQEGDVFRHTMLVISHAKPGVVPQMAALLHDVGKPSTRVQEGEKVSFLGHEDVGADMAEAIMRRLRFDLRTTRAVRLLVANHMRPHDLCESSRMTTFRRFARDVGEDMVDEVFDLAEADSLGNLPVDNRVPELRERMERALDVPVSRPPVLDGRQVMDVLGIGEGPEVGRAMSFLRRAEDEAVAEGRTLTADDARRLLRDGFP